MSYPGSHQPFNNEPFSGTVMAELFEAIGFEVADEETYTSLAEYAENSGERSYIHRRDATLHGRCWKIGGGLEVWSVLYERDGDLFYADCRPAFRSRYVHPLRGWELIEYDEDGEAIMHGRAQEDAEIIFELQNLTELDPKIFRESQLQVALAGLAYSVQTFPASSSDILPYRFDLAEEIPRYRDNACENDYLISGSVLAWREFQNPLTSSPLVWAYVDAGAIRLELLANRHALTGKPAIGSWITANVWLQGHLLDTKEIFARYEGVDRSSEASDFWAGLRRGN